METCSSLAKTVAGLPNAGNGGMVTAGHAGGGRPVPKCHRSEPPWDAPQRTLSAAFAASCATVSRRARWQPSPLLRSPFA
eukprot:15454219-Alexandrium_andersonii.AAC.1